MDIPGLEVFELALLDFPLTVLCVKDGGDISLWCCLETDNLASTNKH